MNLYLRVLSFVKPYRIMVFISLISSLLYVFFNAFSLWVVSSLISTIMNSDSIKLQNNHISTYEKLENIIANLVGDGTPIEQLRSLCIILLFSFLLKNIFFYVNNISLSYVQNRMIMDIRNKLFQHLHGLSLSFFDKSKIADISSIMIRDVSAMRTAFTQSIQKLINEPINILVFLCLLAIINIKLTLFVIISVPFSAYIIIKLGQSIRRKAKRSSIQIAGVTNILQETISGIKVVKAFSMESWEISRFLKENLKYFYLIFRQSKLRNLITPSNDMIGVILGVFLLWIGGNQVLEEGTMDPDSFIRFIVYLFAMLQPARKLGNVNALIQSGLASAERLFLILDVNSKINEPSVSCEIKTFNSKIEFNKVYFQYESTNKTSLNNINMTINKGEVIALVGGSGSGKSTIVDLIPRFYDITAGSIMIDGKDIREFSLLDLRSLMGIVSQEIILFNDSIRKNISYGLPNAKLDAIHQAADAANALEFINDLTNGMDTIIGERGARLSGGQKQRISIARAMLKNPEILILDEATSALDSESEKKVQSAIDKLVKNRTVIMVAHRLSTITNANQIYVLDKGAIIENGNHDKLIKNNGTYRKLYESQFKTK